MHKKNNNGLIRLETRYFDINFVNEQSFRFT